MATLYYAINHTNRTYFELGKGISLHQIKSWPATHDQIREALLELPAGGPYEIADKLLLAVDLYAFGIEEIYNDSSHEVDDGYVCAGSVYTDGADKIGYTWEQNLG